VQKLKSWIVSELACQEFLRILQSRDVNNVQQYGTNVLAKAMDQGIFIIANCHDDPATEKKLDALSKKIPVIVPPPVEQYD
jgi:hypothetical protein